MKIIEANWPVLPGEYFIVSRKGSVAVSTLASDSLTELIAQSKPKGLCIIGKTETENIGIDKIIKNTITNPAIRFLIIAGKDPEGHRSGATILALVKYGVDKKMRIVNSPGKRPVLTNTTVNEIEVFRKQIEVSDMIGCEDKDEVILKIASLSAKRARPFTGEKLREPIKAPNIMVIEATPTNEIKLDKAGYFVIIPECDKNGIMVEYYGYDNRLLKMIKGNNAHDLYLAIIKNGWVSDLFHAAYLGKELEKAELSIRYGFKYVQDGA